jgi:alkanesulfonate monooxygenase SsuD/methylene tetrahydromethanopterin reductase-like flavin-dependent oxidoreductase (luciferase family)
VTRFGVSLPGGGASGAGLAPTAIADAARQVEAAGFESAWVFDAIGRGWLLPDPLTALLGVGAGSTAGDFAALGVDSASRFRRLDESLNTMRRLWTGERVDGVSLAPVWTAAAGGPRVLIGSWAGSRWIVRAAKEFDGWVGSGARSTWSLLRQGLARFRDLGGKRAVATNVVVDLEQTTPSPAGPDDPFDLRCPPDVARDRLRHLCQLGFDDVVLVVRRHDASYLRELRDLAVSAT